MTGHDWFDENFSQEAELTIIDKIISSSVFDADNLKRKLALYPFYCNDQNKSILIYEIVTELLINLFKNIRICNRNKEVELYIKKLKDFEKFDQFFSINNIRGHFIHQFEVFILGLSIMLFEFSNKGTHSDEEKKELVNNWFVTSMFHDFGYPIEKGPEIFKTIAKMYFRLKCYNHSLFVFLLYLVTVIYSLRISLYKFHFKKIISKTPNISSLSLKYTYLNKNDVKILIKKYFRKLNHGLSGMLIYQKNFSKLPSSKNNLNKILAAIFLHTVDREKFKNLKFKTNDNFYAIILYIVDNLQDYHRLLAVDSRFSNCILQKINFYDQKKRISIRFVLHHNNWDSTLEFRTKKWIAEKKDKLSDISDRSFDEGINVTADYITNTGYKLDSISFIL